MSLFSAASAPLEREHAVEAMRKRRRSMWHLNLFSDFPEEIVARPVSLGRPNAKHRALMLGPAGPYLRKTSSM
jgi:hypothetical protein